MIDQRYLFALMLHCIAMDGLKLSRWMAFTRCSSNRHRRSITIWTSCPRERVVVSNSSEALASWHEVFLCAMIVVQRCFRGRVGVLN